MTTPIFDAHSDLPSRVMWEREHGQTAVIEKNFLSKMNEGEIVARIAAIYIDDDYLPEQALHRALTTLAEFQKDIAESQDIEIATSPADLWTALDNETITMILGMEGAEPLMGDPRLLDTFYQLGVRLLTLTHSRRNKVGSGVPLSPSHRNTPGGVSRTGIEVLERAEELGIVVDISHLNEQGITDVLSILDTPVIASHSNCRALCDHPRNLTDEQLAAVADTGGVVCLTAVGDFVNEETPDIDNFCNHIEHAIDIMGIKHVGLGFDFFEYLFETLSDQEQQRLDTVSSVNGLETDESVSAIPTALQDRGFSQESVEEICGVNLLRTFDCVLK